MMENTGQCMKFAWKKHAEEAEGHLVCVSARDVLQDLQRQGERLGMQEAPSQWKDPKA